MSSETVVFRNETQGRVLIFRPDLCSGCGDCIEVCPQKFLRAAPTLRLSSQMGAREQGSQSPASKKPVGWKVKTFPEPEERLCAECTLCLPWSRGGAQITNQPPVLCPWRACTMCDECTRVCPDKAIYTVPLAAEEAPETTEAGDELPAPTAAPVSYEQLVFERPAAPFC